MRLRSLKAINGGGSKLLRLILVVFGIAFLAQGLGWLIFPEPMARSLGMPLLYGVGRSTQIGELGSFFMAIAMSLLLAVTTLKRHWFYAGAMLFGMTAFYRIASWAFHGADFTAAFIIVEVIAVGLLLISSQTIANE